MPFHPWQDSRRWGERREKKMQFRFMWKIFRRQDTRLPAIIFFLLDEKREKEELKKFLLCTLYSVFLTLKFDWQVEVLETKEKTRSTTFFSPLSLRMNDSWSAYILCIFFSLSFIQRKEGSEKKQPGHCVLVHLCPFNRMQEIKKGEQQE